MLDGALIPGSAIDTSYGIDESESHLVELTEGETYTVTPPAANIVTSLAVLVISDQILSFKVPSGVGALASKGKVFRLIGDGVTNVLNASTAFTLTNNSGVTATVKIFVWGT